MHLATQTALRQQLHVLTEERAALAARVQELAGVEKRLVSHREEATYLVQERAEVELELVRAGREGGGVATARHALHRPPTPPPTPHRPRAQERCRQLLSQTQQERDAFRRRAEQAQRRAHLLEQRLALAEQGLDA